MWVRPPHLRGRRPLLRGPWLAPRSCFVGEPARADRDPRCDLCRCGGFSIAEVLIVGLILGVIAAQVGLAIVSQDRAQSESARKVEALDVTRRVIDLVSSDTRNAGFMVPRHAALAAGDGGTNAPDRLCISSLDYLDLSPPGAGASFLDSRTARFDGAVVTSVAGGTVRVDTLDIDAFGSVNDFAVGGGVIVAQSDGQPSAAFPAKGIATHCARIERVDPVNLTITLDASHSVPGGLFPSSSNIVAVPAHIYAVGLTGLARDALLLSELIEDLQVELWVDSTGAPNGTIDGPGEFPIDDLNAMSPATRDSARIRRVRVTVVGRGAVPETRPGIFSRPGVANRDPGQADGFVRQVLTASLLPRNLLEPGAYGGVP
jgi:hypothetical protein